MELFELFIAYISWGSPASQGSSGKSRPVLVFQISDDTISIYPITTQYENKSKTIQAQYFKINDWSQAGLDKQSYIDTGILYDLPISVFDNKKPIGKLSGEDKKRLLAFLSQ
jgi:hypothetical protein